MVTPDTSSSGCKIDKIFVRVVDVSTGRQAYRSIAECCDVILTGSPVVDTVIPAEDLQPDTQYNIQVAFADSTGTWARTLRPGDIWDALADERSAPAMIMVTTSEPLYRTARQAQSDLDAMVFAVDRQGRFGHAAAATSDAARQQALEFCGRSNCEIIDEPLRTQCHALAQHTSSGYWWGIGTAESEAEARQRADRYCEANFDGQCTVDYAYCQE